MTGDAPWTKPARWALIGLVGASLASLPFLVHPWYDPTNDGSLYMLMAESLLEGDGYSFLGRPFRIRPPGFSAMLMPILAGGRSFLAINVMVSLFGTATGALVFVWLRPRLGWPLALAVAAAVLMNSGFQRMGNQAMSDVPYAAMLIACLVLERWADRNPSARRDATLGLFIGLFAYVRSVNIFLVPAILCARIAARLFAKDGLPWLQFARKRLVLVAVVPLLVGLPWSIRNQLTYSPEPMDQNALHSYSAGMFNKDGGDPSSPPKTFEDLKKRVPLRVGQTVAVLGKRMTSVHQDTNRGNDAASIAFATAFLLGWATMLVRKRRSDDFYVLGNLAILSVYFGFDDRLVLPVWLIAFPATIETLVWLGSRLGGARVGLGSALAGVLALAALDFEPRKEWDYIEKAHQVYSDIGERVDSVLTPEDRVGTSVGWHYSIYLDRPVWSFFWATRRAGGFQGAEAMIDKYGLTHVVLTPRFVPSDNEYLDYFERTYGAWQIVGESRIYKVR